MEKKEKAVVEVDKEQLDKMIKTIENRVKRSRNRMQSSKKLQWMLFGKRSEKARQAEMVANMSTLFDIEYPEEDPSASLAVQDIHCSRTKRCWNKDDLGEVERTKIVIEASK